MSNVPTRPQNFWIAVAAAEHARRGATEGGFMQVCHGKGAPLRRIRAGDGVVYYAPTESFRGKDRLQRFVAIGFARDDQVYQVDTGGGFVPFRRDVDYLACRETPIKPLLDRLDFSRGKRNWGYAFRFGLIAITRDDFRIIADAMGADTGRGLFASARKPEAQTRLFA